MIFVTNGIARKNKKKSLEQMVWANLLVFVGDTPVTKKVREKAGGTAPLHAIIKANHGSAHAPGDRPRAKVVSGPLSSVDNSSMVGMLTPVLSRRRVHGGRVVIFCIQPVDGTLELARETSKDDVLCVPVRLRCS